MLSVPGTKMNKHMMLTLKEKIEAIEKLSVKKGGRMMTQTMWLRYISSAEGMWLTSCIVSERFTFIETY
eukprot:6214629-Amphidinium_carterae.2